MLASGYSKIYHSVVSSFRFVSSFSNIGNITNIGNIITRRGITNYANIIRRPTRQDLQKYKLTILDMDGVLRKRNSIIPLADHTFNKMVDLNLPLCILTNESRCSPIKIKTELKMMGFQMTPDVKLIAASGLTLLEMSNIMKLDKTKSKKLYKLKMYHKSKKCNSVILTP